jgi:peptidyl-prolyl cis-trans isomerase C
MKILLKTSISLLFISTLSISYAQNAAVVNGKPISSAKLNRLIEQSGQPNSPELKKKQEYILNNKGISSYRKLIKED